MTELHARSRLVPASLARVELVAAVEALGGCCSDVVPRTYSSEAIEVWTVSLEPPLLVDLHEYHAFDTRLWQVRGSSLAEVEALAARLPAVDPAEAHRWLRSDDPLVRMRGLRAVAVLGEPWEPALVGQIERALIDEHAGVRWAAIRCFSLGRWSAGVELLRRTAAAATDRHPSAELHELLAKALESRR